MNTVFKKSLTNTNKYSFNSFGNQASQRSVTSENKTKAFIVNINPKR